MWTFYYCINGLLNKSSKDICKFFQETFPNSQVAKNFEIASNEIGYMLWNNIYLYISFKDKLNHQLYNLLSLLYK